MPTIHSEAAAGPRFNYEEYMKSLSDKISGSAPNSSAYIGADFQAYMMRERATFLTSVHQLEKEVPIISSINKYESAARGPTNKNPYSPADYSGMRGQHSASVNSLHYMSQGGLSSDRD